MKRILLLVVAFAIAAVPGLAAAAVITAPATTTTTTTATTTTVTTASQAMTGNGAPSGSHYNLNIIGVPKDKTADMTNNDGRRIFVRLWGGDDATLINNKLLNDFTKVNKIFLVPGDSFGVLDANATDPTTGAVFQLPWNVSTTWTVWARALGKPGGSSKTTTCATVTVVIDATTGATGEEILCSLSTTLTMTRTKNAKFENVTSNLLFITYTVDPALDTALATCLGITTTTTITLPLFSGCLNNYFWNYQNFGLKLLQLRFYPVATPPGA